MLYVTLGLALVTGVVATVVLSTILKAEDPPKHRGARQWRLPWR